MNLSNKQISEQLNLLEIFEKKKPIKISEDEAKMYKFFADMREHLKKLKYLNNPNRCPHCDSGNIDSGEVEIDDGKALQDVLCLDCGHKWMDVYKLANVEFYD